MLFTTIDLPSEAAVAGKGCLIQARYNTSQTHKPFLILAEKELKGFKKILLREKNTQIKSIKVKNITSISLYNLAINYNFYSRYFR